VPLICPTYQKISQCKHPRQRPPATLHGVVFDFVGSESRGGLAAVFPYRAVARRHANLAQTSTETAGAEQSWVGGSVAASNCWSRISRPLNPNGELLLGVKLESPEGVANCEAILAVPGLGFAEIGPGGLSLSLGYATIPREPYPSERQAARDRILAAYRQNGVAFLQGCTPDNITARIDEGVRVIAGHSEASTIKGPAHQQRKMPV
jgi:2-keto-3-deoxy-L-rhamnonate aldolase RhmA